MICYMCKSDKQLEEFYFLESTGKYQPMCKACANAKARAWYQNNKEKYNIQKRAYMKQPQNRAAHNGRVSIRKIIRGIKAEYKFLCDCGAGSREKFMSHLLKTMPKGYTLDNYGKDIQVDHIKPCTAFDLTDREQYKKCFNYKNLRFITKSENLSKGGKYRKPGRPRKSRCPSV